MSPQHSAPVPVNVLDFSGNPFSHKQKHPNTGICQKVPFSWACLHVRVIVVDEEHPLLSILWIHSHVVQAPGQFAVPSSSRSILLDWLIDIRKFSACQWWLRPNRLDSAGHEDLHKKGFPFGKCKKIWTDVGSQLFQYDTELTDIFLPFFWLSRMENGLSWMWTTEWRDRLDKKDGCRFFGEKPRPFGGHSEAFFGLESKRSLKHLCLLGPHWVHVRWFINLSYH